MDIKTAYIFADKLRDLVRRADMKDLDRDQILIELAFMADLYEDDSDRIGELMYQEYLS
jgi:hypothetical protein